MSNAIGAEEGSMPFDLDLRCEEDCLFDLSWLEGEEDWQSLKQQAAQTAEVDAGANFSLTQQPNFLPQVLNPC